MPVSKGGGGKKRKRERQSKKKRRNGYVCPICLEEETTPNSPNLEYWCDRHKFHSACIDHAVETAKDVYLPCPMCRRVPEYPLRPVPSTMNIDDFQALPHDRQVMNGLLWILSTVHQRRYERQRQQREEERVRERERVRAERREESRRRTEEGVQARREERSRTSRRR